MTWLLLAIMVFATVLGDVLQSHQMKQTGAQAVNPRGLVLLLQQIRQRGLLLVAIGCMAISFFAFMALLQRAPLSFAVPASAATFVLETFLAKFFLAEKVGVRRWAGTILVAAGVAFLAR
jgi:drug/metabolite transporter (DMT)-like permease